MLADVAAAIAQCFSPPFRSIFWKSLASALLLLILAWFACDWLVLVALRSSPAWVRVPASILTSIGFAFCAAYLLAPISALVASFYADDMAALVEVELDPSRLGRPAPIGEALWLGLRFAGLALAVNAIALCLLLAPVVNVVAFFGANAYLLGRAAFELAALRRRPLGEALALYRRHSGRIFLYGLWIAVLLSIPIANLLTPLFAMALMARVCHRLDLAADTRERRPLLRER